LSPEKIDEMQRRVVFVYENFLASLAHNVYTGLLVFGLGFHPQYPSVLVAVESVRINLYSGDNASAERAKLLANGLPHGGVPEAHRETPASVQANSRQCNAPAHRQKEAKDGAVM
jgi:hypothetical protein